jgi:hypothetical protein
VSDSEASLSSVLSGED